MGDGTIVPQHVVSQVVCMKPTPIIEQGAVKDHGIIHLIKIFFFAFLSFTSFSSNLASTLSPLSSFFSFLRVPLEIGKSF